MAKYCYHALAALSGLFLALAYPGWSFDLGWLVWIGLIPLFWSLTRVVYKSDRFSVLNGFLIGFVGGLVYFLIIFRWFRTIYPLDTLGIESRISSSIIVLLVYLISSAGMALFWGIFGLIVSYWLLVIGKSKSNQLPISNYQLLSIPALFVLLEYLRSWGFGFLWIGSGSLFGPHWTIGNLAYALAGNPLALKLASFVGIYGVSFLMVLVNLLLFLIFNHRRTNRTKMPIVMGIFAGVVFVSIILGPQLMKFRAAQNDKKINFAVIQTAQPTKSSPSSQEMLASLEEQLKLLNQTAKKYPESHFIVFPEASDLFKNIALFLTPAQVQEYFNSLFKESKLIIAGGRVFDTNSRYYSRVFDLDTKNGIINYYDKRLLTPGGEFLPYPIKLIAWLFSKARVSRFNGLRELDIGAKNVSTVNFRGQFKAAPMICSELLSPGLTRQTSQNSDVLVSMASYGIFHGSHAVARQTLAATRFRAAEQAKPIVAATNLGQSYAIDGQGKITYLAADSTPQILTGSIVLGSSETWYNRLGDLPMILASFLLVISSILLMWFKESWRS